MPNLGIIVPDMGINDPVRPGKVSEAAARYAAASLSGALFTTTQQRVLACLFGESGRSYAVNELIQATGAGSGAVQRELARLAGSGLLTVEHVGNQKRYRANPDAPIHDELVSIVRKTFGLAEPLREALAPLASRIQASFLYGSVAKGHDTARSDIDLMVIADELSYGELMLALHPVAKRLGRPINPTVYTRDELRNRRDAGNSFVTRVLQQPRQWLIGSEDDLPA
ncbi:nucleotidyltransferase domain-containing protein [Pseudoxanthomonas sp. F37]|uniref:nucleotidyltransferase domain-containing protein n=1 Tax=Pseudoxanthomonas TaxID=83618 RepID=UPI001FD1DE2E|nr:MULTISPECIES: nucleotidyltransferase domain-containing protein [Pseudoxanthomonas]UOV05647.1 nucleotidyltransferase domain-containing protein [Pseudoxanthomonas mexicana]UOV07209.1 nucleotidyltransferase domain-containing protein [Pseudoxanthomonas sp. F37]